MTYNSLNDLYKGDDLLIEFQKNSITTIDMQSIFTYFVK